MSDKNIGPMGSCLKCSAPLYFLGSYCNQKCEDAITIAFTAKPDTVTISREWMEEVRGILGCNSAYDELTEQARLALEVQGG